MSDTEKNLLIASQEMPAEMLEAIKKIMEKFPGTVIKRITAPANG